MCRLVDYDLIFLEKSWEWLNDPDIKSLTLTPDFTKEEQIKFYKSIPERTNYWIKGILKNSIPIGVVGLKNINLTDGTVEYWGFIGEKEFWGKGIGKFMMNEAIEKARSMGLRKMYLNVNCENLRAKNLYQKQDFKKICEGEIEKYELEL